MDKHVYDEVNKAQRTLEDAERLVLENAAEAARLVESAVALTIKVYHAEPGTRTISQVIYDRAQEIVDMIWSDGDTKGYETRQQLFHVGWLLGLCRPSEMPF